VEKILSGMKHFFRRTQVPWIIALVVVLTSILFLNPFGLQGVPFNPSRNNLPFESTSLTPDIPGPLSFNGGFPLQFWVQGGCVPQSGGHCYVYYNGTLATLDILFWLLVLSTVIVFVDGVLSRIMPGRRPT